MEIPYYDKERPDTGLYNGKAGIWLFLASEVMLFGALFSAYVLLRVGAEPGTWSMGLMNQWVGAFNTLSPRLLRHHRDGVGMLKT